MWLASQECSTSLCNIEATQTTFYRTNWKSKVGLGNHTHPSTMLKWSHQILAVVMFTEISSSRRKSKSADLRWEVVVMPRVCSQWWACRDIWPAGRPWVGAPSINPPIIAPSPPQSTQTINPLPRSSVTSWPPSCPACPPPRLTRSPVCHHRRPALPSSFCSEFQVSCQCCRWSCSRLPCHQS